MVKSERRQQLDIRYDMLEQYILFLKKKGLDDKEIQTYIMGLSESLFKNLLEKGIKNEEI